MAKLYFKFGAMKCGKTTDIIKTYYNYKEKDLNVLIMKPGDDTKAGSKIQSRSGAELDTDYVVGADVNVYNLIGYHIINHNLDCIIVDEAQFLTPKQVDELTDVVDNYDIPVLCYGLRADAFSYMFPGSKRLFEVADVFEELKAVCKCGSKATYNLRMNRINNELVPVFTGEQVSIDGIDAEYDSVCRPCYKKLRNMSKRKKINKKKLFIIIGSILLLIVIGVSIFLFTSKKNVKDIFKYKDKITIEVGSTLPVVNDYLYKNTDSDIEIEWTGIESDDNKIYKPGIYYGSFMYDNEKKNITLVVEDTKAPVIEGVKDYEMLAYEKVPNFLENVTVSDNSMEEITPKIEGEYGSEKVGTYNLKCTASDSSGNTSSKEFKLVVKENSNVKISKTKKGNTIKNYYGITYIDDVIIANKSYSLPSNFVPNNLVTINGYIRVVDYVRDAFNELKSDSSVLGLNIYASSGYRSYSDQKYIYDNYVRMDGKEKADTYSSRAGYSDHQTGLTIDLNTVNISFAGTNESNWLKDNCWKYGFIIRYPEGKDSITGYTYEPWHIRYVGKELAKTLYNNGNWLSLEEYFGIDSKYGD